MSTFGSSWCLPLVPRVSAAVLFSLTSHLILKQSYLAVLFGYLFGNHFTEKESVAKR